MVLSKVVLAVGWIWRLLMMGVLLHMVLLGLILVVLRVHRRRVVRGGGKGEDRTRRRLLLDLAQGCCRAPCICLDDCWCTGARVSLLRHALLLGLLSLESGLCDREELLVSTRNARHGVPRCIPARASGSARTTAAPCRAHRTGF